MSSSLKTLCVRWPASATTTSTFVRCCPGASFATTAAARPSVQQRLPIRSQHSLALPRSFSRANHSLSNSAATKSPSQILAAQRTKSSSPIALSPASSSRSYSSAATTTSPSPARTSSSSSSSPLNWDTFFKLRLRRRRIQLVFSVTTGLIGGAAGAILLAEGFAEPLVGQIPLDPFVTLGLMTFACAGMGWLIGPTIGNQVFYIINRRFKAQMMQKESEFFARVKKHRVDPSNSSAGNPVPDFYGEKIQSVTGYRRWLKDQRAFNKKKTASFV
ncbi:Presequence translocated-associated motor subunit PAM17 [Cladobotryum mycophilum]|uniref:Presequence translocated-associated motor subunit PAM17 n=1 Tax=Cladobotryum mycophilum TaxID=491253 RepID=A0ABR0S8X5_9HYPO